MPDTPAPGDTAHDWAVMGPPITNSECITSGARSMMLDCPICRDVILDVVNIRSGPLDVPRNTFSPLGVAWYARCPACGWTSPDAPTEWGVLETVRAARRIAAAQ